MYKALWTNGPKETIEFFDYTFDEHFKMSLPMYMPCQLVLEYMIGRVTNNCPDLFDKYMKFNTNVKSVTYNDDTSKFEVVTTNTLTGTTNKQCYDKCIWAAGECGGPAMPAPLINLFRRGGFDGRLIHSSDTANLKEDVKGKRILLIGGAYSAEDLALMAIKVGVDKVYVSSRQTEHDANVIEWTAAWPFDKVQVLKQQVPIRVNGRSIQFARSEWKFPNSYAAADTTVVTDIEDIDTVIFCTG